LIFSTLPTELGEAEEDVIRINITNTRKGNDSKDLYFDSFESGLITSCCDGRNSNRDIPNSYNNSDRYDVVIDHQQRGSSSLMKAAERKVAIGATVTDQQLFSSQTSKRLWWSICRMIEPQTADSVLSLAEQDFVEERQRDRHTTRSTLVNWLMVLRLLCKSFGEQEVNPSHWRRMRWLEKWRLESLPIPPASDNRNDIDDISDASFPPHINWSPKSVSCLI